MPVRAPQRQRVPGLRRRARRTALEAWRASLRDGIGRDGHSTCAGMPQQLRRGGGLRRLRDFADTGALLDSARAGRARGAHRAASASPRTSRRCRRARRPASWPLAARGAASDGLRAGVPAGGRGGRRRGGAIPGAAAHARRRRHACIRAASDAGGRSRGLMPDIDRWVLERAIGPDAARGATNSAPVRLFVSQSPRTLARDAHAEWLRQSSPAHGVDGTSLVHRPAPGRCAGACGHPAPLLRPADAGRRAVLPEPVRARRRGRRAARAIAAGLRAAVAALLRMPHAEPALRDELRGVDRSRAPARPAGDRPAGRGPQAAATLWMSGID